MNTQVETGRLLEQLTVVNAGRRHPLKLTAVSLAVLSMMSVYTPAFAQGTLAWDKTFPKSERVDHRKVSFYNRLGIHPSWLECHDAAVLQGVHELGQVREQRSRQCVRLPAALAAKLNNGRLFAAGLGRTA